MKIRIVNKSIVLGIIVLFIGANIVPGMFDEIGKQNDIVVNHEDNVSDEKEYDNIFQGAYTIKDSTSIPLRICHEEYKSNEDKVVQLNPLFEPDSKGWGTTEVVSTESTYRSSFPSLYIDTSGTVHVVWQDETAYGGSGSDIDIFYKRKPYGGSWSTTEVVSTESTSNSQYPSLFVDASGTVHVAWDDGTNYGGSGYENDIFYKRKPSGGSWTITEVVSTESTSNSYRPSLFVDASGMIHVAWEDDTDYAGCGSDSDIFYKRKPSGGSWSTTEVVSTESTDWSLISSLFVDASGTVHVAWCDGTNYGGSGSDSDIFYKRKPSGGSWSTTEVVSTEGTGGSFYPSLFVDTSSTVHITWFDHTDYSGSGSDPDIFYKRKPSGGSWSTTEVVSTESTHNSQFPSLAVDASGTVHIAWEDQTAYGGSGSDIDIFYKRKLSGGSWNTTEVVSTESTSTSWEPSLAVNTTGTVHVAWYDFTDYSGSGTDADIFYKRRTEGANQPPYVPGNPSPTNHATGVNINADLSWAGGDPDPGDTVTYDIYFGTTNPPPKVVGNQSGTLYNPPGSMNYNTMYYWRINAWDNHGAKTEGVVWDFTTEEITYSITFSIDPSIGGIITFDGVTYNNGESVNKQAGTYNIIANPNSGFSFIKWTGSPNIVVTNPNSASTTATVYGNGTLKVDFNRPPDAPSNPSPANYASGINVSTDLSWNGNDPDSGDTVTYDVYFGVSSNPPKIISNQSGMTYDPGTMSYNTNYYWKIVAWDNHGASTIGPQWQFTTENQNSPPEKPATPSGQTSGEAGITYTYITSTNDPDEDQVYYMWDWGDGTQSAWLGPYDSGQEAYASHAWSKGTYAIKVKAKDTSDAESQWSDLLPITMPCTIHYRPNLQILKLLLERFPNVFPILRHLLGY